MVRPAPLLLSPSALLTPFPAVSLPIIIASTKRSLEPYHTQDSPDSDPSFEPRCYGSHNAVRPASMALTSSQIPGRIHSTPSVLPVLITARTILLLWSESLLQQQHLAASKLNRSPFPFSQAASTRPLIASTSTLTPAMPLTHHIPRTRSDPQRDAKALMLGLGYCRKFWCCALRTRTLRCSWSCIYTALTSCQFS